MKTHFLAVAFATFGCAIALAQQPADSAGSAPDRSAPPAVPKTSGDYTTDLQVVTDAQKDALSRAKEMLEQSKNPRERSGLEAAIKLMERSEALLEEAKNSPAKFSAALAAEEAAYQALLKSTPREFQVSRSQGRGQGGAGQPDERQLDQLELQRENNHYETERQATPTQTAQQREQLQIADRLKALAQRQQDLNERLRELQNALQAARTEQEREDIERQLKRLRDEERQMMADVDELRQRMEQSPNANSLAESRQQLEQTRTDMERASEEMDRQSASQALAAGTRAQQRMQTMREDLRRQTSSQFSEQMRQLRNEARDLDRQEEEIAKQLDSLQNGAQKSLDDAAKRQQITEQMERQQNTLTNLLGGMRAVTEQAESTEPLLSKQLYDTLRRADQSHTDNLLQMTTELTGRGFFPQASEVERSARTNIIELRRSVERAAESVLGNEADAVRYAQKELDDLTRQVEREMSRGTNASAVAAAAGNDRSRSNRLAQANSGQPGEEQSGGGTNSMAGTNSLAAGGEMELAGNDSRRQQRDGGGSQAQRDQSQRNQGQRENGNRNNNASTPGQDSQNGQGEGEAGNQSSGNPAEQPQLANNDRATQPGGSPGQAGQQGEASTTDAQDGRAALRQMVERLGGGDGGGAVDSGGAFGGPITGNNYVDWADRLRDVERVLDSQDLRDQLAVVRDRVGVFRTAYRERGIIPPEEVVRQQILVPMTQVRVWLQQELARQENNQSLVPLDRDPVPETYSELVRKYYEKLGSAQ
jgi:hypothetical protein